MAEFFLAEGEKKKVDRKKYEQIKRKDVLNLSINLQG